MKPFLRWAGGKNWLTKSLPRILPSSGFKNYYEPFLGGGSIFLSINSHNKSFLSDLNEELIQAYCAIKDDPQKVINYLQQYENTEEFYYKIRSTQFSNVFEKAARFIYLNQTSFNGIYRVNLKGEYNVPFGHRTKNFLEPDILKAVSDKLRVAELKFCDFQEAIESVNKFDLVFLDPPYTVSHNNNGFIKYNQKLFSLEDQYRLRDSINYIKSRGAYYILTNAAHEKIFEIFDLGDHIIHAHRASLIGGANAKRGKVSELIFTNIENGRDTLPRILE